MRYDSIHVLVNMLNFKGLSAHNPLNSAHLRVAGYRWKCVVQVTMNGDHEDEILHKLPSPRLGNLNNRNTLFSTTIAEYSQAA